MDIKKFCFGSVMNTEAVVLDIKESNKNDMPYLKIGFQNELTYELKKKDIIYGLGENVRGINKKGWIYESFCSDEFEHTEDRKSIYAAHNFLILQGSEIFGVFIDCPGKVIFDLGYTKGDLMCIKVPENNFDLYIIQGNSLKEIAKNFRELVGKSYIAPKWAFGYQQSRWGYKNKEDILNVVEGFKKNDIPIDGVCLDIDYMERFKDFTIDKEKFGDFENFVKNLKSQGIRLIPIIDAGVKIEKGYDVYDEGVENGYFCVDKNNKPFVAAVWPGKVHFPDFLNEDVRAWFGEKYKYLIDKGIEGFWNDMNEPAIFYTEKSLKQVVDKAYESKDKNLDVHSFFELNDSFLSISNRMEDYKSFYHRVHGKIIRHDKVHNLYGYNMTRAAAEAFEKIAPNKRFLIFSRSSAIGMHRYGGIWTGDNKAWWSSLELNIKMMPNLNICGFIYSGADTGGFACDCTEDLLIRWNEFSMFTPLYRNHSANDTRNQEPYSFSPSTTSALRTIIENRYAYIPYIYSEYMKACMENECYFKPMTFEYEDDNLIEDQLLVGDSLMIAPVYKQNAFGRYVYLPEEMVFWNMVSYQNRSFQVLPKGHHYIEVELEATPIFIRKDKILVLGKHSSCVDYLDNKELDLIAFVDERACYNYYDDDGITKEYNNQDFQFKISIEKKDNDYEIDLYAIENCIVKKLNLTIIDTQGKEFKKELFI
ncbi:Alpha-xylosidase [Clostridium liquoris]|uniref:Alpha-xylosidase n=1 Tax=Clostridium liquoris TaxID=1289519 RepID=A0A2T0B1W1_9CLOT|nr:TIM-barrel domain-containing protein [Clostridium liquoris]PRR77810.1 Alpha-xylosidase [Clostridium liquoris]